MTPETQQVPPRNAFDYFLAWFDYDADRASRAFADFRKRLTYFFRRKGCRDESDDLTSEVVLRASKRVSERWPDSEPGPYLFRMAGFVNLERLKRPPVAQFSEGFDTASLAPGIGQSLENACEIEFLRRLLPPDEVELLLNYYDEGVDRSQLAEEKGCSLQALRVRIHKIKSEIKERASRAQRSQPAR